MGQFLSTKRKPSTIEVRSVETGQEKSTENPVTFHRFNGINQDSYLFTANSEKKTLTVKYTYENYEKSKFIDFENNILMVSIDIFGEQKCLKIHHLSQKTQSIRYFLCITDDNDLENFACFLTENILRNVKYGNNTLIHNDNIILNYYDEYDKNVPVKDNFSFTRIIKSSDIDCIADPHTIQIAKKLWYDNWWILTNDYEIYIIPSATRKYKERPHTMVNDGILCDENTVALYDLFIKHIENCY